MSDFRGDMMNKGVKVGEWWVTVDHQNKIVKTGFIGKEDVNGQKENMNTVIRELKKFDKGEPCYFDDLSKYETKLPSSESTKIANEGAEFTNSYCKRCAVVIPSFMLRKAVALIEKGKNKYFGTEKEAMDYLLKG